MVKIQQIENYLLKKNFLNVTFGSCEKNMFLGSIMIKFLKDSKSIKEIAFELDVEAECIFAEIDSLIKELNKNQYNITEVRIMYPMTVS